MIELLFGLGGAVAILAGSLVFSINRTAKYKSEKDNAVASLDNVRRANKKIRTVIKNQEEVDAKIKKGIAHRNYFGN